MSNRVEASAVPIELSANIKKTRGSLFAAISAALAWVMLTGCGDVYRPVANPVLKPGGDPQAVHIAVVISNNSGSPGVATAIDVSGDSNIGNFPVGRGPVHAAFAPSSTVVVVANQADDSLSIVTPLALGSIVNVATLPTGSAPVYVASTQNNLMYVANSGTNTVGVVPVFFGAQQTSIPVGRTPVALAETPDGSTLYSVNQGDGTVTAISTKTNSAVATIPVGSSPTAAAMNSDGKTLYVLNRGSGSVSAIDVAANAVIATVAAGASPRFIIFDPHLRRLYVANTGTNTVSVFNADVGLTPLATVAVGAGPASIAPLLDGTRFYVANAGCSDAVTLTGCSGSTVSVVDAVSFAVRKTITVGSTPVSLAADPQSTKVVVANRDSNNITDIRTSDDTVVTSIPSGGAQPVFVVLE